MMGVLEVLAAIGLVAPAALDLVPILTAIAASGVVLLMLGAGTTHLRRGQPQILPVNVLIGALALFIAIERFGPHSLYAAGVRVRYVREMLFPDMRPSLVDLAGSTDGNF